MDKEREELTRRSKHSEPHKINLGSMDQNPTDTTQQSPEDPAREVFESCDSQAAQ